MNDDKNNYSKDMKAEIPELGIDIVKSFHEQFAQNQNHHQVLFVQVLAVLVTVLVGFGYVYIRTKVPNEQLSEKQSAGMNLPEVNLKIAQQRVVFNAPSSASHANPTQGATSKGTQTKEADAEPNITVGTLYAFLALATILLSFGIALISNMALGFRRDQMVASNIRILSRVMQQPDNPEEPLPRPADDYFPASFNPVGKRAAFSWMPEFHKIFLITLFAVKLILAASVIAHPQFGLVLRNGDTFVSVMFWVMVGTVLVDLLVGGWYWWKWKITALGAFGRLHSSDDKGRVKFKARLKERALQRGRSRPLADKANIVES